MTIIMSKLPNGIQIVVQNHVLKRYLTRTEQMSEEKFKMLSELAKEGDSQARSILDKHRKELKKKFRYTYLYKFLNDGAEIRREFKSPMNKRCTFIAKKEGNTFYIKTVFLQGKKRDFWKVGNEEIDHA